MRRALVLAALGGVLPLLVPTAPAEAQVRQIYPFCHVRYEGFFRESSRQCGFTSFAQCMATASGLGGMCEQNPEWLAQPKPAPKARKARAQ